MSKPERGSLTTLLAKKPLGQGAPATLPIEQAESALLGRESVNSNVQPYVRTDVQSENPAQTSTRGESSSPAEVPSAVQTAVRTDVRPDVPPTKLLNRSRRRTVRVPWTFKLPFDLREELEAVARFNNLNMTEIAVEAIERHLRYFPHPPGGSKPAGEVE